MIQFLVRMNSTDASLPHLRLRVCAKEDATVVECSGRLTADVAAILRNEVRDLIPRSKRIIIDLTDLTHMDSSGLGALVGLYVSARRASCELRLINLNKQVRELLGMTNLLSVFETCGQFFIKMP